MAVFLVCPKCDETTVIEHLPVEACPQCGNAYPTQARLGAEAALIRDGGTKPGLIVIGQMLSAMGGGILIAVFALAILGRGQLTLFGDSVSGADFIARAGPTLAPIGVILAVIAIGLSRNARWTRPLMLLMWSIPITEGLVRLATGRLDHKFSYIPFMISVVALPAAYMYLYRRDKVKRYFDGPPAAPPTR